MVSDIQHPRTPYKHGAALMDAAKADVDQFTEQVCVMLWVGLAQLADGSSMFAPCR